MSATATNSKAKTAQITTLPPAITVEVNGAKITAPAKLSSKDNIWFEAVQQGELRDGVTFEDALLNAVVAFEGNVLPPASRNVVNGATRVALSEPRKYSRSHAKAGQAIPGTGGNPVISFVQMLPVWGERGYMLRVTLTGITKSNGVLAVKVSVACQGVIGGKARVVGHVDGDLSFG